MEGSALTEPKNHYRERLSLPDFDLEDFVDRPGIKPFHLMVLALLEHGAPMDLGAIVVRLFEAGADEDRTSARVLKKAWHGLKPVYKGPDERYGLILDARELRWLIRDLELEPRPIRTIAPPPAVPSPPPDSPLTREEVEAAFKDGHLWSVSPKRQAAAVLDAAGGGPLPFAQVEAALAALAKYRHPVAAENIRYWRGDLVLPDRGGIKLNLSSAELSAMRQAVRKLARPILERRARDAHYAPHREAWQAEHEQAREREIAVDATRRRALLHVAPDPTDIQAAIVLDVDDRSFLFFGANDGPRLARHLEGFEVLIGLYVRDAIIAVGLDPGAWQLVDLRPPQRTLRLNQQGRTLKITPDLLITSTTGISRPLADPAKIAEYLATGDTRKLSRRLESEVKALHAFYRYGVLHGFVRLRWGFKDEILGVDWALPSDARLNEVLEAATISGNPVDIVAGTAPGWQEPWARARRYQILSYLPAWEPVVVKDESGFDYLDRREIQAARSASSPG